MYRKTKYGFRRTGSGGTYPVNNGDPQCDDEEFDPEEVQAQIDEAKIEYYESRDY